MANSTSPVPQVVEGSNAVAKINQLFDASSQAMIGGKNWATTALLVWGYLGGRVEGINVANGTLTLGASTTSYIVMKKSDGVVSFSTGSTNWDNSTDYWRLYSVVTNTTAVTTYTDERFSAAGLFGANSGGSSTAWGDLTGVPAPIEDIAALTDPGADRLLFWDDSAGEYTHATLGTNLSFTGTTLNASGGGGVAWGAITGTLGDQTDLQAALDAKADPGIAQNSQSTAYTLVLGDANKHILHPSADTTARIFTIPANSSVGFPIGTAVTFVNQDSAGVVTIAITTDTMRLAGAGTTGSRTLAANGMATALKITSTEWIISGTGLT